MENFSLSIGADKFLHNVAKNNNNDEKDK